MKYSLLLICLALVGASTAHADRWNNEQDPATMQGGTSNGYYPTAPTDSSFAVSDVVADNNWTINSVQIQAVDGETYIPNGYQTTAYLNIFANSGTGNAPLAGNNPMSGTVVNVTFNYTVYNGDGQNFTITADGLNINLAKGEYWIGLTPISTYGHIGETLFASNVAGAVASSDYYQYYGSTNWYQTTYGVGSAPGYLGIDINGTVQSVPEPASFAALGLGLIGLISRRRRKA